MISFFIPEKWTGWVFLIILLESTVITQLVIASPDFILLTASVIALRGIFQRKLLWLAISLIFLCGINMRGVFTGSMLLITHLYFDIRVVNHGKKYDIKKFMKLLLPYVPVFLLLSTYFLYYFSHNHWFFPANSDEHYSEHYILPENISMILKHLVSLVVRFTENGRIVIWLIAIYFLIIIVKKKIKLSGEESTIGLFFVLLTGLYLVFVFITRMPFSPRYFMVHFFLLSLLTLCLLSRRLNDKKMKITCLIILLFTISGHFWIYPEKIAQSWESTLLHTPYYKLRKECFDYIDKHQLNYNDISAGFCLYGNRGYIELENEGKIVKTSMDTKYFIYSNISNLKDEKVDELKNSNLWIPIKQFKKTSVFITIYKRNYKEKSNLQFYQSSVSEEEGD
jgi:hypothetical protein